MLPQTLSERNNEPLENEVRSNNKCSQFPLCYFSKTKYNKLFEILSKPFLIFSKNKKSNSVKTRRTSYLFLKNFDQKLLFFSSISSNCN